MCNNGEDKEQYEQFKTDVLETYKEWKNGLERYLRPEEIAQLDKKKLTKNFCDAIEEILDGEEK